VHGGRTRAQLYELSIKVDEGAPLERQDDGKCEARHYVDPGHHEGKVHCPECAVSQVNQPRARWSKQHVKKQATEVQPNEESSLVKAAR
jgi:hypothetical protein